MTNHPRQASHPFLQMTWSSMSLSWNSKLNRSSQRSSLRKFRSARPSPKRLLAERKKRRRNRPSKRPKRNRSSKSPFRKLVRIREIPDATANTLLTSYHPVSENSDLNVSVNQSVLMSAKKADKNIGTDSYIFSACHPGLTLHTDSSVVMSAKKGTIFANACHFCSPFFCSHDESVHEPVHEPIDERKRHDECQRI